MTAAFLAGSLAGLGLFLLGLALRPPKQRLARRLAAFDAARRGANGHWTVAVERDGEAGEHGPRWRLGSWLAKLCAEQGWEFPSLRRNLSLAGIPFEIFLATKVLLALLGAALGPLLAAVAALFGFTVSPIIQLWLGLLLGAIFFFLPDLEVKQKADRRRRDFRHAIGSFLDLFAMNLAGGRGVPEALMTASEVGTGWAFWRIRDALANSRISGQTPWYALGALGEEVGIDELRDLSAALSLVAEDGAKVRESLVARAESLRRRELTDLEGQAGERSQSMLVAQLMLCAGFLLFLVFPVVGLLGV
jgi:Flp pilus assembly protein TadB